ncbi:putative ABC transport system ATP-binding protein [Nocardioides cavernae]|uniref:Putative ABC transport system ATP-binding protein n=1 Tax=Nocardioides cavernae TaxID=1921566 RepID=A0A7Y9H597_9ACTN|nr:ABC transporter ATP-binding protein [Nocardioides cavernae]NYE38132.1 putative ABC transport system ATP-binding protein [Nocardioides cavernae]
MFTLRQRPPQPGPTPALRPGTGEQAVVSLAGVWKTYDGAVPVDALRGVDLRLAPGSVTAVMGPSGSGKSTLLNVAAGLDTPTRGTVVVGGHDLSTLSQDALTRFRRGHVGFVFQGYNLLPHLDVVSNIALPLVLAGRQLDAGWAAELVGRLGLTGLEQRRPGELSGGQAQRVAIARALATRPAVIFADEPTGALDSRSGKDVLALFLEVAHELGQTLIIVTHDASVAAAAEEAVLLADGRIADRVPSPTADGVAARLVELGR